MPRRQGKARPVHRPHSPDWGFDPTPEPRLGRDDRDHVSKANPTSRVPRRANFMVLQLAGATELSGDIRTRAYVEAFSPDELVQAAQVDDRSQEGMNPTGIKSIRSFVERNGRNIRRASVTGKGRGKTEVRGGSGALVFPVRLDTTHLPPALDGFNFSLVVPEGLSPRSLEGLDFPLFNGISAFILRGSLSLIGQETLKQALQRTLVNNTDYSHARMYELYGSGNDGVYHGATEPSYGRYGGGYGYGGSYPRASSSYWD